MAVVLAIDAGTSGVRSFALDELGQPAGYAYQEFPQHYPRPGWVEHDPVEIWNATVATLGQLLRDLGQPTIAAIGITNQRETVVAWDRATGAPRHRAIVWQDRRTAARCEALAEQGHLDFVRRRTGLVLDPYFSATKMEWLLGPGGVTLTDDLALGTVDSWLLWNLTRGVPTGQGPPGLHATEASNASRTMLFDIETLDWSDDLLQLFGVPRSAVGEIRCTQGRLGTTGPGLPVAEGVPISGIAGDQQAALFGQACLSPGMSKNTYGTGSFVLENVGDKVPAPVDGLLNTVAWTIEGQAGATYALEGAIFVTGAATQWLRDGLGIIDRSEEIGPLAEACTDPEGVYIVPAFTGLGSPWWDPQARGTIVGITRGTGRAHLARAVVEAMAYQTRDVLEAMAAASGREPGELRVDGGAAIDVLCQFQADQLGVKVARPVVQETTALGAAYLAGVAEGVWADHAEVADLWRKDREWEPGDDRSGVDARHQQWRRAVERSRAWDSDRSSAEPAP
jgi:glycerol kinase